MNIKKAIATGAVIISGIVLAGCSTNQAKSSSSEKPLTLTLKDNNVTLNSKGEAEIVFSTLKNVKYKVLDKDNQNSQIGKTYTTKTGNASLTLFDPGHYRLEVKKGDTVKDKDFVIKGNAKQTSEDETKSSESSEAKLSFGKPALLGDGENVAELTINSVDQVSPGEDMVVDISSNESDKKQFVIVSYTLKAIKGDITVDDFDGSNLSIADSQNQIGSTSSNRDNGIPEELKEGQSIKLRIGAGFVNSGDTSTIVFGNDTWTGNITK